MCWGSSHRLLALSFILLRLGPAVAFLSPSPRTKHLSSSLYDSNGKFSKENDAEVINAVEVAFEEIRTSPLKGETAGVDSTQDDAIKKKVADALGVNSDSRGFAASSQTLRRVQDLSEEAGIAFMKAREYLEYLQVFIEDRAERDAALLAATVDYVRQRSIVDTRRVLAAAADATRPLVLLAEAASDPSKRSNLTLSEGLALLQSGVSPLQSARRLETFRFNEDEDKRLEAVAQKRLLTSQVSSPPNLLPRWFGGGEPPPPSVTSLAAGTAASAAKTAAEVAANIPYAAANAASAANDVGYRARRAVGERAPGETALEGLGKLPVLAEGFRFGALLKDQMRKERAQLPAASTNERAALDSLLPESSPAKKRFEEAKQARMEREGVKAEQRQRMLQMRAAAESMIRSRELSGITATAASAVASTEEANEAEMLSRVVAALDACRIVNKGNEWGRNATRESAAMRSLSEVLRDTKQEQVRAELQQALSEREAFVKAAGVLTELERALASEAQNTQVRLRVTSDIAQRAASLAAKVSRVVAASYADGDDASLVDKELQKLSIAARDVIPKVDRKSSDNARERGKAASKIGALRSRLAAAVRGCQPMLGNECTSAVVSMLVDVAKVEAVVETAAEMAENSERVREYTASLEALGEMEPGEEADFVVTDPSAAAVAATASFIDVAEVHSRDQSVSFDSVDAAESKPVSSNPPITEPAPAALEVLELQEEAGVESDAAAPAAAQPNGGWMTLSSTLPKLGVESTLGAASSLSATSTDPSVIDVNEAEVSETPKELTWTVLLLRFLDLGFFVGEEVLKVVVAATPVLAEMFTTAADRAVKALGDGTTGGPSGLSSLVQDQIDDDDTSEEGSFMGLLKKRRSTVDLPP